jgi:hypothetical protein
MPASLVPPLLPPLVLPPLLDPPLEPLLLPLVPPPLEPPLVLPPLELPPLEPPLLLLVLPHGPQTPLLHAEPGQQSALLLQVPHAGTHCWPKQTNGGLPPSTGLGTHGWPPQQSALDAHPAPASTHWAYVQRGTPTLSCWQVSRFWPSHTPLQQSQEALHDMFASLQTSPLGLHPIGLVQIPTPPSVPLHLTGPLVGWLGMPAEPQQSLSLVQRSPTGWHPLAGWQTSTPVGPQGAHERLQHAPPHRGTPPST